MKKKIIWFLILAAIILAFLLVIKLVNNNDDIAFIWNEYFFTQVLSDEDLEAEHNRQLQAAIRANRSLRNVYTDIRRVHERSGRAWTLWRYVGTRGYILHEGQSLIITLDERSIRVPVDFQWEATSVDVSVSSNTGAFTNGITARPTDAQLGRRVMPQIRNEIDRREYRIYTRRSANEPWAFHSYLNFDVIRSNEARLIYTPISVLDCLYNRGCLMFCFI